MVIRKCSTPIGPLSDFRASTSVYSLPSEASRSFLLLLRASTPLRSYARQSSRACALEISEKNESQERDRECGAGAGAGAREHGSRHSLQRSVASLVLG